MRMPRHPSRRRVAQKSAPPPRIYLRGIIERARLLFPKPFMQFLKALGAPTDDPFIAHLRAMPIAIAMRISPGKVIAVRWRREGNNNDHNKRRHEKRSVLLRAPGPDHST